MTVKELNNLLIDYDQRIFDELEPIIEEIALNSKALAVSLKSCFVEITKTDRYLKFYRGEEVAMSDKELEGDEFMIFRKYVRLLRSCTIMCGNQLSLKYKKVFLDFFMGERLQLARKFREISKSSSVVTNIITSENKQSNM